MALFLTTSEYCYECECEITLLLSLYCVAAFSQSAHCGLEIDTSLSLPVYIES